MKSVFLFMLMICTCISGCSRESGVLLAKDSKSLFDDAFCDSEKKILNEDTTGSEQYRIYHQGATAFVPPSALREEAEQQALRHCEKMGKSLKVLQETAPPFKMGCFPKAELIFVCLPKPITPSFEDQLYIKLSNLKKLLDDGTITKDEFEMQKAKILDQK